MGIDRLTGASIVLALFAEGCQPIGPVNPDEKSISRGQNTTFYLEAGLPTEPFSPTHITHPTVASPTPTETPDSELPTLRSFIEQAKSPDPEKANVITGVYSPNLFAFWVIQQPKGQMGFVSLGPRSVTQFRPESGSLIFLAHTDRAGRFFTDLKTSDPVLIVRGDGSIEVFTIDTDNQTTYSADDPFNPYTNYHDAKGRPIDSKTVVNKFYYLGPKRVVFQTCGNSFDNVPIERVFITGTIDNTLNFLLFLKN